MALTPIAEFVARERHRRGTQMMLLALAILLDLELDRHVDHLREFVEEVARRL